MKFIYLTALLLVSGFSFGQNTEKLWNEFRNGSPAKRVKACDVLGRYYLAEASDSLKTLGQELFLYGINEHYYPAIEQGKLTLATWFILNGQTADGITMAKALIPNMEERGDDRMVSGAASTIAIGYVHQKDGKSAKYWANRALHYAQTNPDPLVRAEALQVLGESYLLLNQPKNAVTSFERYIKAILPYKAYRSLSAAYGKLGDIARLEGDIVLAEKHFKTSMSFARLSGATSPLAHAINNLAIVYFESGDTTKARESFTEAMHLRLKINEPKSISESFYNLGDYFYYTSEYDKALQWYTRSLDFAKEKRLRSEQADAIRAIANVYKSTSDFKSATEKLELFVDMQQEIIVQNSADDEEIAELEQTINRLEVESEAKNGPLTEQQATSFKWEWLVIGVLAVALITSLLLRRKAKPVIISSDAPEK